MMRVPPASSAGGGVTPGAWVASLLQAFPALRSLLLLAPALLFLGAFYIYPLAGVLWSSVSLPAPGLQNYAHFFRAGIYLHAFAITLRISLLVTALCLLLGYPVAYCLTRVRRTTRGIMLALILIPFWTSLLVRTYAWMVILQRHGIVNQLLSAAGLIDTPLALVYNTVGTVIGMTHILLPMTILSVYTVLLRIDLRLTRAARTMGASPSAAFRHVYLPLSMPGVAAGALLTFVSCLGFYITPALLGGSHDIFIAQLIQQQIDVMLNVGFAAAIATMLLAVSIVLCLVYGRVALAGPAAGGGGNMFRPPGGDDDAEPGGGAPPLIGTLAGVVLAFLIAPIFVTVPLSFSAAEFLTFPPPGVSLRWYAAYLGSAQWRDATWLSLEVGAASALLASVLGTLAALGLAQPALPGKAALSALLISPILVPVIIYALAIYQLYARLHLIGTAGGLVLAYTVLGLPFVLITVSAALQRFDTQLWAAARTHGAGPLATFRAVTLPLIRPSLVVGALLAFVASFDEVVVAIFISGASAITLPKQMWDGVRSEINPTISAVATVMTLLSLGAMAAVALVMLGGGHWERRQRAREALAASR